MSDISYVALPPRRAVLDTEGFISLLTLVGLLTFFHFAFARMYQAGGEKRETNRMFYGNSEAA